MNIATAAVLFLILAACVSAVCRIRRQGTCGCGGNCSSCGHDCAERIRTGLREAIRRTEDETNGKNA